MSLARVRSRACVGVSAPEVSVEVHLGGGLPSLSMVGLPETAVKESRDRVRAALLNSGFEFPARRITISLAPADLPKEGGGLDLPIALGILAASKQVSGDRLDDTEFMGELSLGGKLRPVRGLLPAAVRTASRDRTLVLPMGNEIEAALLPDSRHVCANTLLEVCGWLCGQNELSHPRPGQGALPTTLPDMADVVGQALPRRALEIAAAGQHNMLMSGPPGTGKSMLASRLASILPDLSDEQALETAALASVSVGGFEPRHWRRRPFRAPHHSTSGVALVGGGSIPRPGEISLAHNGVLFLDELTEFNRSVLEVLREPMESGSILISRAARQAEFPARFQLVAAMNPCPCGLAGTRGGRCSCSAEQVRRYLSRVSGPLLDRIDIRITVPQPRLSITELQLGNGESSKRIRRRVCAAHSVQMARQACSNARLDGQGIKQFCALGPGSTALFDSAADVLELSPRACHRGIRLARTIADLDHAEHITKTHMAEALALRSQGLTPAESTEPHY